MFVNALHSPFVPSFAISIARHFIARGCAV